MADTSQIVRWTLQQSCAVRQGEAVRDPGKAMGTTSELRQLTEQARPGRGFYGRFGDVYVTEDTHTARPHRKGHPDRSYPSAGFIVSEPFRNNGDVESMRAKCLVCPANVVPGEAGGCAGWVDRRRYDDWSDERMNHLVVRLGLEDEMAAAFPATTPRWLGWWMNSPLSPEGSRLLAILFAALAEADENVKGGPGPATAEYVRASRAFVRAATRAATEAIELHVSRGPPGHTDFGFHTVFAHCPRCKTEADLPRWKRRQPVELQECRACGCRFSPAETARSERMDEEPELRDVLGQQAFEKLAFDYLIAQGASRDEAAELVAETEQAHRERMEQLAQMRAKGERGRAWVRSEIYAGLDVRWLKEEDEAGPGTAMFTAEEFEKMLRRACEKGATVRAIFHYSTTEGDEPCVRCGEDPKADFAKLREKGCNELFFATVRAPDSAIE